MPITFEGAGQGIEFRLVSGHFLPPRGGWGRGHLPAQKLSYFADHQSSKRLEMMAPECVGVALRQRIGHPKCILNTADLVIVLLNDPIVFLSWIIFGVL